MSDNVWNCTWTEGKIMCEIEPKWSVSLLLTTSWWTATWSVTDTYQIMMDSHIKCRWCLPPHDGPPHELFHRYLPDHNMMDHDMKCFTGTFRIMLDHDMKCHWFLLDHVGHDIKCFTDTNRIMLDHDMKCRWYLPDHVGPWYEVFYWYLPDHVGPWYEVSLILTGSCWTTTWSVSLILTGSCWTMIWSVTDTYRIMLDHDIKCHWYLPDHDGPWYWVSLILTRSCWTMIWSDLLILTGSCWTMILSVTDTYQIMMDHDIKCHWYLPDHVGPWY